MNAKESERLLSDVLSDPTLEQFQRDSLSWSLHRLRRRKHVKATVRLCSLAVALLVPAWFIIQDGALDHSVSTTAPAIIPVSASVQEPSPAPIKEITDAELLSLFPKQTVALIGPPGKQHLLVLGNVRSEVPVPPQFPRLHQSL